MELNKSWTKIMNGDNLTVYLLRVRLKINLLKTEFYFSPVSNPLIKFRLFNYKQK